ncbi:MAG: peptidase M14 [Phycisphaerales bacterium]|nr:peptidase M14 [Phycisphaerales bacterium]
MNNRFSLTALFAAALLSFAIRTPSAVAQQQLPAKVEIAWNRYYDFSEVVSIIARLVGAYPNLLSVEEIGKSVQGRPLLVVTLNNPSTGSPATKPAMWIDGNIHGNEIQATETVLYSIDYLCRAYGSVPALTELVDQSTFYFLASVNPDGRANWFSQQNNPHSSRTGMQPTDDDRDGSADEDGPDDLDGDGSIGQMWRKDPLGSHRRNPRDPRILERVSSEPRPDGTIEHGEWSHGGSEGIDNDGDGHINEDGPGGYDMNRNWPSDWQPAHVENGAGDYPLCFPETRAIAAWVLNHPNIAAAQSYHNAGGMILRGPGADYREVEYSREDRATYDAISSAGAEMLPHYRPMVIFKELYTVHGGFVNWIAESLGVISFTNELWSDNRILQNGRDPTPEEMVRWRDRVLFGQTTSDWKELSHPEYGSVLVGGGTKWSSRIPPPFMLEEEAHRNFAFTVFHAQQMPRLRFSSIAVECIGEQLWQVTVAVANDHRIPTRTVRASRKKIGFPDHLTLAGLGVTVVSGGPMAQRLATTFDPVRRNPHDLAVEVGVGGLSTDAFRFIVRAPDGARATVRYSGEKFKAIEQTFTLTAAK